MTSFGRARRRLPAASSVARLQARRPRSSPAAFRRSPRRDRCRARHGRTGARLGARAGGAGGECGPGDAAAGRARLRALHGRHRPADGDPADRADPVSPAAAAAVYLHRRRDRGVDGAGAHRDSPGVVRCDLRDADRAARGDWHADQRGDQARPQRHRLGRGRAARPPVEVQQVALRTPARDGLGCTRALRVAGATSSARIRATRASSSRCAEHRLYPGAAQATFRRMCQNAGSAPTLRIRRGCTTSGTRRP